MDAKRGYVPEDDRNFSQEAVEKLKIASRHIRYLINEGYDLKQASTFVGNHYMLSERQRLWNTMRQEDCLCYKIVIDGRSIRRRLIQFASFCYFWIILRDHLTWKDC